jgi:ribosome-binding protein aMBF1 (putative translation factor)
MKQRSRHAVEILSREFGGDPQYRAGLTEERVKLQAARAIYDARTAAGLTQQQLARRVGTTQSVIARLEDADYEGHTLRMLNRIAAALDRTVEVRFMPASSKKPASV